MRKLFIHFERVPVEVAVKVLQKENPAARHKATRKAAVIKSIVRPRKLRTRSKNREVRAS